MRVITNKVQLNQIKNDYNIWIAIFFNIKSEENNFSNNSKLFFELA
jgi:hypothetical protein